MSLFSWLTPKSRRAKEKSPPPPSTSGLSRMESTKPYQPQKGAAGPANAQPANKKHERMARRELLYNVVREAMVRAGVLSSSYKFKVLSLDSRGRQFLVMVDLAQGAGGETARLAEIEASVAQMAKTRYDILVSAVYWRSNEHVAVGDARNVSHGSASRPMPLDAHPVHHDPHRGAPQLDEHFILPHAALPETVSQPAELMPAPERKRDFDPLHPEEVAAFQRALAAGATQPMPATARPVQQAPAHMATQPMHMATQPMARGFDGAAKHGPQSYTLLTGFEDTELPEDRTPASAALSATQYGELR